MTLPRPRPTRSTSLRALLFSGTALLLFPGDRRISHFMAAGGILGVIFALPAFVVIGPGSALMLIGVTNHRW